MVVHPRTVWYKTAINPLWLIAASVIFLLTLSACRDVQTTMSNTSTATCQLVDPAPVVVPAMADQRFAAFFDSLQSDSSLEQLLVMVDYPQQPSKSHADYWSRKEKGCWNATYKDELFNRTGQHCHDAVAADLDTVLLNAQTGTFSIECPTPPLHDGYFYFYHVKDGKIVSAISYPPTAASRLPETELSRLRRIMTTANWITRHRP